MADYRSMFSCVLDVGSPPNVARALALFSDPELWLPGYLSEGGDGAGLPFRVEGHGGASSSELWLHDGGYGSPQHVADFVLACAANFDLNGRWGFRWADTCSAPRLDGFGGGAEVIDLGSGRKLARIDCHAWLEAALVGPVSSVASPDAASAELAPM